MKLKPCPFCGHDLNKQDFEHDTVYPETGNKSIWSINCDEGSGGCSAQLLGKSMKDCVDKWNTRSGL